MAECIERAAAVKVVLRERKPTNSVAQNRMLSIIQHDLLTMRAADVAPVVHGRIVGSLEDGRYRRRFSCCGDDATMITQWAWPKYCPNCGAKMDGGADNG